VLCSLDGDGVITREEWYVKYGTYDGFDQFDADGDGKIDAKEFRCTALHCEQLYCSVGGLAELKRSKTR
jgi:hypothetical protein